MPGAEVEVERSSPLGLLSVVRSPEIPFRHAPGLSLNNLIEPAAQVGVFTDGEGLSPITAFDGDLEPLAYLDFTTAACPITCWIARGAGPRRGRRRGRAARAVPHSAGSTRSS